MVFFTRNSYGCLIQETHDRTVVMVVFERFRCCFRQSCQAALGLNQMPKQVVLLLKVYLCYGLCFPPPYTVLGSPLISAAFFSSS